MRVEEQENVDSTFSAIEQEDRGKL